MRIVFIETPSPWLVRRDMHIPLGPLYLATVLNQAGYKVRLARPERIEDIFQDDDIVCMSGTTLEYPMNVEYAQWIKASYPDKLIFIGGPHATAMYKDVSKSGLFDAICVGEGEPVILDMVKDAERAELKKVYFSNGFIKDLDTIPIPNRSLIEGTYGKNIFLNRNAYKNGGTENITTSRGCSFNCAFCASRSMWDGRTRYRSIENIVAEIEGIIALTGTRQFTICDDNFTLNKKRCLKLCDRFREFDIAWRCILRADRLDLETCEAIATAGCKEIWAGIESGDQRVLDFLDKRADAEAMLTGCKNAKKAGLTIRALFMIGTPGERVDTPELNREYMRRLDFDMITLSMFTPLPGSPIWDDPDKYNCEILTTDFKEYNQYYWIMKNGKKVKKEYEPVIHNKFLSIEQMKSNVERMRVYVEATGKYNRG